MSHGKNHAVVGDFNINSLTIDQIVNEFLSNFLDGGYIPYFSGATRPNDSGGTCIDNLYIKCNLCSLKSFTYTNSVSDYSQIIFLKVNLQITNASRNN